MTCPFRQEGSKNNNYKQLKKSAIDSSRCLKRSIEDENREHDPDNEAELKSYFYSV
jgi:hypothetical protein